MRLFTTGVSTYEWGSSGDVSVLLVPVGSDVLLFDPNKKQDDDQSLRIVYDGASGAAVDPHLSPNCQSVAFVINNDLYVHPTNGGGGGLVRLTTNGEKPGHTCGLADFIAQEEMDRYRGFWWSPNSTLIAYTETDETHIPEYQILHQGKADPKHAETHRYPFAGQPNPRVRLAVTQATASSFQRSVWMDLAGPDAGALDPEDFYLARVGWWPDNTVMAQVQNRRQTLLQLLRLDPATGQRQVLVEERTEVWINLHDILHVFGPSYRKSEAADGSFFFLWASERSGFSQLYLYKYDATARACSVELGGLPVGEGGEWVVESIDAVDEEREIVYFSGNHGHATEKHLVCASFASAHYTGGAVAPAGLVVPLTTRPGWHQCVVNVKLGIVADVFSSKSEQPRTTLYRLASASSSSSSSSLASLEPLKEIIPPELSNPDTKRSDAVAAVIAASAAASGAAASNSSSSSSSSGGSSSSSSGGIAAIAALLRPPELISIPSRDGKVTLHCAVYAPDAAVYGPGPYPAIVSVYGGPHVQRVSNNWPLTADLRAQRLAQDGCLVVKCDSRGSSRRGLAFEGAVKWNMGALEVEDQQVSVPSSSSPLLSLLLSSVTYHHSPHFQS